MAIIIQSLRRWLPLTIVADDLGEAIKYTAYPESTLNQWKSLTNLPDGVTGRGLWARRKGRWMPHRTDRMKQLQLVFPALPCDPLGSEGAQQIINANGGKLGRDRPEGWAQTVIVLTELLEAAIAGGLAKERAEACYDQIMRGLIGLSPASVRNLLASLHRAVAVASSPCPQELEVGNG